MRRWANILNEEMANARLFREPPLRSRVLVYLLSVLALELASFALVVGLEWRRMPVAMLIWVIAVAVWTARLWLRALRDHRNLRTMFERGEVADVVPGSPLDKALRATAESICWGLFSVFGVSTGFVFSLAVALGGRGWR